MARARIEPYLFFNGNCEEAMAYYAGIFGAEKPWMMRFREVEGETFGEDMLDKVMHTNIVGVDGANLMMSDDPMRNVVKGNNVGLTYSTEDEARVREVWDRFVAAGAAVTMPLGKTFFAELFGILTDAFGVDWMIMQYTEENASGR